MAEKFFQHHFQHFETKYIISKETLLDQALGLKKLDQIVEHNDTPQIRGMVNTVKHLVHIVE